MTDLISLAKQAGFDTSKGRPIVRHSSGAWVSVEEQLQAFADLIRQQEREACDALKTTIQCHDLLGAHPEYMAGKEMAVSQFSAAIRART